MPNAFTGGFPQGIDHVSVGVFIVSGASGPLQQRGTAPLRRSGFTPAGMATPLISTGKA